MQAPVCQPQPSILMASLSPMCMEGGVKKESKKGGSYHSPPSAHIIERSAAEMPLADHNLE